MTITLGSLTLGVGLDLQGPSVQTRGNLTQLIQGYGVSYDYIGTDRVEYSLRGVFKGTGRKDYFEALNRARRQAESLKLDSNTIESIVWLNAVRLSQNRPLYIEYELQLIESRFRQLSGCEATAEFSQQSGGGTVAVEATYVKEGTNSIELGGTIGAGTSSTLRFTPTSNQDINEFEWFDFRFRTSSVTNVTHMKIHAYTDASNYVSYDFSSDVTSADTWYRIRVKHDDMTETGTMDWTDVDYYEIEVQLSDEQTYTFYVDDFGCRE